MKLHISIHPFADLGVVPEAGASFLLPRRYGRQVAAELLILGDKMSPYRAKEIGLVKDVITDRDVREHAYFIAQTIAEKPPIAMRHSKELIAQEREELLKHVDIEARIFAERAQSDEMRAVIMKMMSK